MKKNESFLNSGKQKDPTLTFLEKKKLVYVFWFEDPQRPYKNKEKAMKNYWRNYTLTVSSETTTPCSKYRGSGPLKSRMKFKF